MIRRLICKLLGHRWGAWYPIKTWSKDWALEKCCHRCGGIHILEKLKP